MHMIHARNPHSNKIRINLTEKMLKNFLENIMRGTVSEFCAAKGLSYTLAYNLAHGRIRSLSAEDYRLIFGEEPPIQEQERVDSAYFRRMVELWLFLNKGITKSDLYREFYSGRKIKKVDYRIFVGAVRTVEIRLERMMEQKFLDQGVERTEIESWLEEFYEIKDERKVPYEEIKPVLEYLKEKLGVHPSRILNQAVARYKSGELINVRKEIYDDALKLKERAVRALTSGSRFEIESLKEEIYGDREGLTLYSEVEEELAFLKKFVGKSPKRYLGRSLSPYGKSKLKRIASWRVDKIRNDCEVLIRKRPDLSLRSLPKSHLKPRVARLTSALRAYLSRKLIEAEDQTFEKAILAPSHLGRKEYEIVKKGITSMNEAADTLGFSKGAFDLLVANNAELFRRIGSYDQKWYLPDFYLKELREKEGFDLVRAKYEFLAKENREHDHSPAF